MAVPTEEELATMRLLAADTTEGYQLISDAQYGQLFTLEGGNVRRAAAAALETIATSEILIAKKISTQDLSVDGPAVAAALRTSAAALRAQADKADADADADQQGYGFDFVDVNPAGAWAWW